MRFASAFCLAAAMILLLLPWHNCPILTSPMSGLEICAFNWSSGIVWDDPLGACILLLPGLYPFGLFVGLLAALVLPLSRRRAVVIGTSGGIGLAAMSMFYLQLCLGLPLLLQWFTVWFYLSHALCLVCVLLSVVEFRRAGKPRKGDQAWGCQQNEAIQ